MDIQDFSRSKALNNVPQRKLQEHLSLIESSNEDIQKKNIRSIAINRYYDSNIPVEYWLLRMDKDFIGDPRLLIKYDEYIADLKQSYIKGKSVCFAGQHGVGKTTVCACILKKAVQKGFTCLYTTLSDVVNTLTQAQSEERFIARKELTIIDFLVIDEFDPRFIGSDNAADLYARSLETIFRTRSQNKLPTLMCTNSPNVIETFNGTLKQSLDSLIKGYLEIFPVFGEDFRKRTK